MPYSDLKAGLVTTLQQRVPGLTAVLGYEPTSIEPPVAYVLLDGWARKTAGGRLVMDYDFLVRVCFRWQDVTQAELDLDPFVNALPDAIDRDPTFGGAVTSGLATAPTCKAVWVTLGGVLYRALDMMVHVVDKTDNPYYR